MPAITRVLSSGFFIPADADNYVTSTKATIGLGLGLPTDFFGASIAGDELDHFVNESASEDSGDELAASPPLLPTRRSRRPSPIFSAESEYRPMSTPSPSIRGASVDAFERLLDIEMPSALRLPHSPTIGLGIALPCFDAPELARRISERDAAVGLGFDLPCLAERELVTIIRPTLSNTGIDFSVMEEIDISDAAAYSSSALETIQEEPEGISLVGLGFASPFWASFAALM